ncbi:MAG: 5-formyltetrahydrofolate cyclo-ligase [Alphaproteobacteria bacterium]|nr:5-formyltetrahydrofolate cyclo-ligase [Alphaproteobacteria bacterium]
MSATDNDAAKPGVRAAARANREALFSGLGAAAAAGVAARFMAEPLLSGEVGIGTVVAGYAPIGSELDPRTLMERIAARGSTTCLPVVVEGDAPLEFRRWAPGEELVTGAYGIPIPPPRADVVTPDLLLVPMLAFDRRGHRLGYGGGYYDRTIAGLRVAREILAVGLAFSGQLRDDIPAASHDMVLDWIVTESAALRVENRDDT